VGEEKDDAPLVLEVSRQFDAAPELVFDAWLDAESVALWLFATPGGVMERVRIDPRVGGVFEVFERRGEQLATHYGTYLEIERPTRLAFDFANEPTATPTRVTISFEARDGGCFVTLSHALDPAWAAYKERAELGWAGILEGLDRALLGEPVKHREIVQTREYDAPRPLVWTAWTNVEHVDKWWGPNGFVTRTESSEVRPDGVWRYTMTGPDGTVFPNFVRYMDVSEPERLIYAHGSEEAQAAHFYVTVLFEALGAKRARVTMTSRFPSKTARDFVVEQYGAIEGGKQTLARLAAHLEKMQ
jgi:uncharacterized protein YndB with AHSA1/START domain